MNLGLLGRAVCAVACLFFIAHGSASGVYDGQRIVRVSPADSGQRLAVKQLSMMLMSEAAAPDGSAAYLADDDAIAVLQAAGVEFEVLVDDVQSVIDAERTRLDARARFGGDAFPRGADVFFEEFRDLAELDAFYGSLVSAYPGLISVETIGQSIEGRPIKAYTISGTSPAGDEGTADPDDKPSLIVHGMIHAREWISPMTVTYLVRGLVEGYGTDDRITTLLDTVTFRVIPILNPDGFDYTWTNSRLWRKNRRGGFGVDLNRNFSTGWGGSGSSGSTGSNTYRGSAPFSEPESRALRDYILSVPNRVVHVDVHSFSQLVLWPYGFTPNLVGGDDGAVLAALGTAYADDIKAETGARYTPQQATDLYVASGITTDWAFVEGGVFGWTIELRPASGLGGGFNPPPDQILPCARENFEAFMGLGEAIGEGVVIEQSALPTRVEPGALVDFALPIIPAFMGPLDQSAVSLFVRPSGAAGYVETPMTAAGGLYTAQVPSGECGGDASYYLRIAEPGGRTVEWPFGGEASALSVAVERTRLVLSDDMETGSGWTAGLPTDTATLGFWELADPAQTLAQPEDDTTPGGTMCWITDNTVGLNNHTNDVDDGATTLLSPRLDASAAWDQPVLSFSLWFYTSEDPFEIDISADDGATWQELDRINQTTDGWERKEYPLAGEFASSSALRVRFVARDEGQLTSLVEAAVDDLRIETIGCNANPADLAEPFGVLDTADLSAFITAFLSQDPIADFVGSDGVIDLSDITAFIRFFEQGAP